MLFVLYNIKSDFFLIWVFKRKHNKYRISLIFSEIILHFIKLLILLKFYHK